MRPGTRHIALAALLGCLVATPACAAPPEQAARQGEITRLAFLLLGREQAIDFLNGDHAGLGGRPLALATASDAGRASVEAELGRMKYRQPTTG
jgi:uncharacterized protein (DUF2384 family)